MLPQPLLPPDQEISAPAADTSNKVKSKDITSFATDEAAIEKGPSTGDPVHTDFSIVDLNDSPPQVVKPLNEVVSDSLGAMHHGHELPSKTSSPLSQCNCKEMQDEKDGYYTPSPQSTTDSRNIQASNETSGINSELETTSTLVTPGLPLHVDSGAYQGGSSPLRGSPEDSDAAQYWDALRRSRFDPLVHHPSQDEASMSEERGENHGSRIDNNSDIESEISLSYINLEDIEKAEMSEDEIKQPSPHFLPPHLRAYVRRSLSFPDVNTEFKVSSEYNYPSEPGTEASIQSTRTLINSIKIANVALLVTRLYSKAMKIQEDHVLCSVDPNPRVGSKNLHYLISLESRDPSKVVAPVEWLIQIPLNARKFTVADRFRMGDDIRTLAFIDSKIKTIPIPTVYSYDPYDDNALEVPYILMRYLEGNKVEFLWPTWGDKERTRCLAQCAHHFSKLGLHPFERIGCLGIEYSDENKAVDGLPIKTKKGTEIKGPFGCKKDFLMEIWHRKMTEIRDATDPYSIELRNQLILLKLLIEALTDQIEEKFYISLPEIGCGNILADSKGNITGIVGWDGAMIVPKELGYARYPSWITQDWLSLDLESDPKHSDSRFFTKEDEIYMRRANSYNEKSFSALGQNSYNFPYSLPLQPKDTNDSNENKNQNTQETPQGNSSKDFRFQGHGKIELEQDMAKKKARTAWEEKWEYGRDIAIAKAKESMRRFLEYPKPQGPSLYKRTDNNMARYRSFYNELMFEQPGGDWVATKESLIMSSLHTALHNEDLRHLLIPNLAKHVLGWNIGPNIVTMVANSKWGQDQLFNLGDKPKIIRPLKKKSDKSIEIKTPLEEPGRTLIEAKIDIKKVICVIVTFILSWILNYLVRSDEAYKMKDPVKDLTIPFIDAGLVAFVLSFL